MNREKIIYYAIRSINSLIGILISFFVIKYQGKESYATIAQLIAVSNIIMGFSDGGYLKIIQVDSQQYILLKKEMYSILSTLTLLSTILIFTVSTLFALMFTYNLTLVPLSIVFVLSNILSYRFLNERKLVLNALFQGTVVNGLLIIIAFFSSTFLEDVSYVFIVLSILMIITLCANFNSLNHNLKYLWKNSKRSISLLLSHLSGIFIGNLDIIIFGIYVKPDILAEYIVITRLSKLIFLIQSMINQSYSIEFNELLSNGSIKKVWRLHNHLAKWLFVLGIITTIFFMCFGPKILSFWEIESNSTILVMLSSLITIVSVTGLASDILIYSGKEFMVRNISFLSLIFAVGIYLSAAILNNLSFMILSFGLSLLIGNLIKIWKLREVLR